MKTCVNCSTTKNDSEFYKSADYGLQSFCKDCKRQILKDKRAVSIDLKQCSECKETRPLSQFLKNKRSKDGLTYNCKLCKKQRDAEWFKVKYPDNKESF